MLVTYAESRGLTAASTSVVIARSYSRYSRSTSLDSDTTASGCSSSEDRAHPLLVRRVGVGVQEADAEGVDALVAEPARHRAGAVLVERAHLVAVDVEPALDALDQVARDDPVRLHPEVGVAVAVRHRLPGDLEHRLVAGVGDEAEPVDLALEQLVGRDRGAVRRPRRCPRRSPPSSPSTLSMPARKPSAGLPGVEGVLVVTSSPVSSSNATTSVNVPPVSMPMRMRRVMPLV